MSSVHDDSVRARLAEIRASAGVPHSQVSLEVLYFLPKDFITAYGILFTRAVTSDAGESSRNQAQVDGARVGKAAVRKTGAGPTVQGGGKKYKRYATVLDERALGVKTRLDKRLRQMAREIEGELAGMIAGGKGAVAGVSCGRCGMFLKTGWRFCPQDGTRVEAAAEVEPEAREG